MPQCHDSHYKVAAMISMQQHVLVSIWHCQNLTHYRNESVHANERSTHNAKIIIWLWESVPTSPDVHVINLNIIFVVNFIICLKMIININIRSQLGNRSMNDNTFWYRVCARHPTFDKYPRSYDGMPLMWMGMMLLRNLWDLSQQPADIVLIRNWHISE